MLVWAAALARLQLWISQVKNNMATNILIIYQGRAACFHIQGDFKKSSRLFIGNMFLNLGSRIFELVKNWKVVMLYADTDKTCIIIHINRELREFNICQFWQ